MVKLELYSRGCFHRKKLLPSDLGTLFLDGTLYDCIMKTEDASLLKSCDLRIPADARFTSFSHPLIPILAPILIGNRISVEHDCFNKGFCLAWLFRQLHQVRSKYSWSNKSFIFQVSGTYDFPLFEHFSTLSMHLNISAKSLRANGQDATKYSDRYVPCKGIFLMLLMLGEDIEGVDYKEVDSDVIQRELCSVDARLLEIDIGDSDYNRQLLLNNLNEFMDLWWDKYVGLTADAQCGHAVQYLDILPRIKPSGRVKSRKAKELIGKERYEIARNLVLHVNKNTLYSIDAEHGLLDDNNYYRYQQLGQYVPDLDIGWKDEAFDLFESHLADPYRVFRLFKEIGNEKKYLEIPGNIYVFSDRIGIQDVLIAYVEKTGAAETNCQMLPMAFHFAMFDLAVYILESCIEQGNVLDVNFVLFDPFRDNLIQYLLVGVVDDGFMKERLLRLLFVCYQHGFQVNTNNYLKTPAYHLANCYFAWKSDLDAGQRAKFDCLLVALYLLYPGFDELYFDSLAVFTDENDMMMQFVLKLVAASENLLISPFDCKIENHFQLIDLVDKLYARVMTA